MGNDPSTPHWCNFSMDFARQRIHCVWRNTDFFGMRYQYNPFTADLLQINCSASGERVSIKIEDHQILLFIMLEGRVWAEFTSANLVPFAVGEFVVADRNLGQITINLRDGINSFMVITIEREWYRAVYEDYFAAGLSENSTPQERLTEIFKCSAGHKAEKWIKSIYRFSHLGVNAVDGNLRMNIALLLEYYFKRLENHSEGLAHSVKHYLDQNYRNQGLSVRSVADHFHVTERTLRNHFKKEFNQTVHRYYTQLRMQAANELITVKGFQAKDIYDKLGYNDESTFRYAYTRYLRRK
ncbi:helix-turn-helix transcriptional regulator [Flavobacterium sp. AG291]|uniref:helix-turn-helix transcriptional regulator n=1 Tax=Flavobacterium sp. AG291 TaxID=2184000 RepID=UPI001F255DCB|nr:response regulator transcription factor [Flavobacterium sp. AG291]